MYKTLQLTSSNNKNRLMLSILLLAASILMLIVGNDQHDQGILLIIFFATGSMACAILSFKQLKQEHYLRKNGRRISAEFVDTILTRVARGDTIFTKPAYRIRAQWIDPDSNLTYVFRSEILEVDPSEFLKGKRVNVIIDPQNPSLYIFD